MKKIILLMLALATSFAVFAQNPHFAEDGPLGIAFQSRKSAHFTGKIAGLGNKLKTATLTIVPTIEVQGTCNNPGVKPGKRGGKTFDCSPIVPSVSFNVTVDRNGRIVLDYLLDVDNVASGWAYNCLDCGGNTNWTNGETPPSICISSVRIFVNNTEITHQITNASCFQN